MPLTVNGFVSDKNYFRIKCLGVVPVSFFNGPNDRSDSV